MKSCESKENMRRQMRPVTLTLATAALWTAIVWAAIVTRWTTGHELATTILFAASIPFLIASTVFSAIAAVRLGKPPGARAGKSNQKKKEDPRSPQDTDTRFW